MAALESRIKRRAINHHSVGPVSEVQSSGVNCKLIGRFSGKPPDRVSQRPDRITATETQMQILSGGCGAIKDRP